MSGTVTKRMLRVYEQMAAPTMFLTGLFQSPPENFYTSETVEIDIIRSDEDIAVAVTDLTTGYRMNSEDLYTNKEFKAPIFKEAIALNATDLIKRMAGEDPFKSPDFRANLVVRMFRGMVKVERKIRRALEQQASQVLQTGIITLTDMNGAAIYSLDYKPKATHFPTAGTAWGQVGATPLDDINALAQVIRDDGLEDPDELLMGIDAYRAFVADDEVVKVYDTRRLDQGTISPMQKRGNGGTYRGTVEIGNYRYDIWTYGGQYKDPQTGNKVQFIDPNKVVVRSSTGRMDATFGAIPNIGKLLNSQASQMLPELPSRLSNGGGGMDLHTNVWMSNDGENLWGGVGSRPLLIPTAIDTYGCLTAIF